MDLRKVASRMTNMVVRGVLSGTESRVGGASTFKDEGQGDVLVAQPAGFSSNPGEGDAIILALNGHASKRVSVVIMDGTGMQAPPGSAMIYSPSNPEQVVTISDEGITVSGNNISFTGDVIEIEAGTLNWNGKRVAVEGDLDTAGDAIV